MLFSPKALIALLFAATTPAVHAFGDTSPHIFFSSKQLANNHDLNKAQYSSFIVDSSNFDKLVRSAVSDCSADAYIFVNQPSLHSYDLSQMKSLRQLYDASESKFIFSHVSSSDPSLKVNMGTVNAVVDKCGAKIVNIDPEASSFESYIDTTPRAIVINFATLPAFKNKAARNAQLAKNDELLSTIVASLPTGNYIVVFTSSSLNTQSSEPTLIKRDGLTMEQSEDEPLVDVSQIAPVIPTSTLPPIDLSNAPLFEKYQFFSTGIFESTIVALLLIAIFFTSYNWLASLQITYAAFEKPPQIPNSSKAQ